MKIILLLILFVLIDTQAQTDPFESNQFMLAESFEQAGNFDKAIEIIEQLYRKTPNNQNYFNKLYNLYLNTKKYETAIRLVELRLASLPEDISLYGLLGSVYYLSGDIVTAKSKWEIPIRKNPENPFVYRMIANYAMERRAFEIAIEYLLKGKSKSNDLTIFAMDLGELYIITMQYESALNEYCELLLINQGMYPVIESKIFSFISKPDVLQNAIKIVNNHQKKGIVFKNLLARLYTESKNFDRAFELLIESEKLQSTDGQQLLNFANFLINENEFETAKKVFEYTYNITENKSVKSSAKLGQAKSLESILWNNFNDRNDVWKNFYQPKFFSESQTINVINAYEDVINLFRHSDVAVEALFSIGRIWFYINNDLQKAEQIFNEIITNYPTSRFYSKSLLELSLIKLISDNYKEAEEILKKIESVISHSEDEKLSSYYYLSKIYALNGNWNSALENIRKITGNVKSDFTNDALEFSQLLNVAKNDSINLIKYTQAGILIIRKKFKEAQILFDEIASNQQSLIFLPFCLLKSAEIDIALDNYDSGMAKLERIYSSKEKNIFSDKALYLKARIYEHALKDLSSAVEIYQKLLMEFPKSIHLDESRESIIRLKDEIMKKGKDA